MGRLPEDQFIGLNRAIEGFASRNLMEVGMFDFQVVDNVNTVTEIFSESLSRRRPWMA